MFKINNLLIAQSGGPTAVINSSIAGILEAAFTSSKIDTVYGGVNGIQGILDENLVNLSEHFDNFLKLNVLYQTPSAVLGSCRFKLKSHKDDEQTFKNLIDIFRKYSINYFIYIGGNDSMDTINKIALYLKEHNITDIIAVGVPKTIDNDLIITDHCPGYGSAAKYVATTISEVQRDYRSFKTKVVNIVEIMGRDSGWLAASSALSRINGANGPDLIYLPESHFDIDKFLKDVEIKLKERNGILIAVSEGIKYKDGTYVSSPVQSNMVDAFNHKYIAGAGRYLTNTIDDKIGCKTRCLELSLMQRCASHISSATDVFEASMLGKKGVSLLLEGRTGQMATILREQNTHYSVKYSSCNVTEVANSVKTIPQEWITEDGTNVSKELFDYMSPLIQGEINVKYSNGIPAHVSVYDI